MSYDFKINRIMNPDNFADCTTDPCQNGGTCTDVDMWFDRAGYSCTCMPGFIGGHCQWGNYKMSRQNAYTS